MTLEELQREIERLNMEIAHRDRQLQAVLSAVRSIQETTGLANCKAMALINHMTGTDR